MANFRNRKRLAPVALVAVLLTVALSAGLVKWCSSPNARPNPNVAASPDASGTAIPTTDPQFSAWPGAKAYYGQSNGAVYQVEIPDNWTGAVVFYLHGSHEDSNTLWVEQPPIRGWLVRNGYAWAASSYDNNDYTIRAAADQTAALYDLIARRWGKPAAAYIIGPSMGGGGVIASAERYGDRYSGALSMCGTDGKLAVYDMYGDTVVAAAYAAGLTQQEFDDTPINDLMARRILPALASDDVQSKFQRLWIAITGGPRPFGIAGLGARELADLDLGRRYIDEGLVDNESRSYDLGSSAGVSSAAFNEQAIRIKPGRARLEAGQSDELTGDLHVQVMTLHTTGDGLVPLVEDQVVAEKVAASGRSSLLVQRAVQSPGHCQFTSAEIEDAFAAVVNWASTGTRPDGEDIANFDPAMLGARFTSAPRIGSPAADAMPNAAERMELKFNVTVDGQVSQPDSLALLVERGGLLTPCNYTLNDVPVDGVHEGTYDWWLAPEGEVRGCGAPGAQVYAETFSHGHWVLSDNSAAWSAGRASSVVTFVFHSAEVLQVTEFAGSVYDAAGKNAAPGTRVAAFIGSTLCGQTSVPPIATRSSYWLLVVGPNAIPACTANGAVSLRVDGQPVPRTFTAASEAGNSSLQYDIDEPK
jgi:hypothetical protein